MPPRPIAYNLVRLLLASMHTTPRGVDRIDLGYLSHLMESWPAECFGVAPSLIGMRIFPRDRILRGRDALLSAWQENDPEGNDPAWEAFKLRFADPCLPEPALKERKFMPGLGGLARLMRLVMAEGISLGQPITGLPKDAIYLDIGHFGLTVPRSFHWRAARPDITPVFMIHDAIPLEMPEMVAAETVEAHRRVIAIAAREASAIITPTAAAGESIRKALARHGRGDMPIYPVPLPIDALFGPHVTPAPVLAKIPYFVICGAIEPRKNHALLIRVWEQLAADLGPATPRLIIAGSPGHHSADVLAKMPALREGGPLIQRISGLSSPALAELMAGARAILMPSFAEGFGLPPVEGMAMGVPAILSDIPAHREAAGLYGQFLPAEDAPAWQAAIMRLTTDPEAFAAEKRALQAFRPTRWPDYMARIGDVLAHLPVSSRRAT